MKTTKTLVRIPDPLNEWLKRYADENYISKHAAIVRAIKEAKDRDDLKPAPTPKAST